jgi:transcriptional regulator with XRE-family HTH domain
MLDGDPGLRREWERTAPERAIADALVGFRRDRGLSQGELARAAGWDQAFVSRLESGRAGMPTLETLARYARVCDGHARLALASSSGTSTTLDLDVFTPSVEPASSELAPHRQRHERRLARSSLHHRAEAAEERLRVGKREVERDEEAVVAKEARVTGEVAVGKDVDTRTETVRDTVRKQEVEVGNSPRRGSATEG